MSTDTIQNSRPQHFLQTAFWASFKEAHGWKALYFKTGQDGRLTPCESQIEPGEKPLTVLVRTFSLKIKKASLAYIPMAPELDEGEGHQAYLERLCEIADCIKGFLPKYTLLVRYDCPIDFSETCDRDAYVKKTAALAKDMKIPLYVSPVAVQPPDTTIVDLQRSEEEILSAMKSKWRYNIRLAAKKGVEVSCYHGGEAEFEEKFDEFYRLFELTSERDGVSFHAKKYYRDLIERSRKAHETEKKDGIANDSPIISLYLARHEGDYLAGIITLFCRREAVYLYGASGNIKRNLMAAYLLQWTAMKDAKAYGCPEYDFYGMPPTDDESHPMHGLYLFKTGFGGRIVHRPGSFDIALKPCGYRLYITAEKARAFFFRKLVKKLKGR
ncbi:MAG: peptidoglycan bridge formation glycyltransferase FemA/FemB family protein [Treponema sp.]|nr:peptidoglycan bridge formation glycyltransferase FemA/FemB family protein [Treponema sp.]